MDTELSSGKVTAVTLAWSENALQRTPGGILNLVNALNFTFWTFFFFLVFFKLEPATYGGSQARGQIGMGAAAASLHHSHNTRSKPRLRPPAQFTATLDPQPSERGQGLNPHPRGH